MGLDFSTWQALSFGIVAGFLLQKGKLDKDDVGKSEVLDYASFAAEKRKFVKHVLLRITREQIKKKTVKIDIAR